MLLKPEGGLLFHLEMTVSLASSGKKKPLTINPENLSEHGIYTVYIPHL